MTLMANTTIISRRGTFLDHGLLPFETKFASGNTYLLEIRMRLRSSVLELTKLSLSYRPIQAALSTPLTYGCRKVR